MRIRLALFGLVLFLLISPALQAANPVHTTMKWRAGEYYLVLQAYRTTCLDNPGASLLRVTVMEQPAEQAYSSNKWVSDANLTAWLRKPGNASEFIYFDNNSDGNYTYTHNYDLNGTYKWEIHAVDSTNVSADINSYVYVGDFNINIRFMSNFASYTPSQGGQIRNYVWNDDGNVFTSLAGVTTIYYPDSSVFANNQALTEAGLGEYYYNFTVPSTLGTYSATSSFSCGSNIDQNSQGRFTVSAAATCSDGIQNQGETGTDCGGPCPACGYEYPGPSGGGPPIIIVEKPRARIERVSVFPLTIGVPATVIATIVNDNNVPNSFLVTAQITQGNVLEYYSEGKILDLKPQTPTDTYFAEKWIPGLAGTHILTVKLLSLDKATNFDTNISRLDIAGELKYDLILTCLNNEAAPGTIVDFNLLLYNAGDYYEDVELSWWMQSPDGAEFGRIIIPIASYPKQFIYRTQSLFVPSDAELGAYKIRARVTRAASVKEAECSFQVVSGPQYYLNVLYELDKEIEELLQKAEEKKAQGFDVSYIERMLENARKELERIRGRVLQDKLERVEEDILRVKDSIAEASTMLDLMVPQLQLPLFLFGVVALIVLIVLLIILLLSRRKKKKERKHRAVFSLSGMLGLEADERIFKERKKKKKSLFDKILGLEE